ncbi:hypothetical protein H5410_061746 [Solanum commersonii]|uniref:Secreted protein n=1 Tax=Solanum commersonii TaxID=4109 RepID=A0A9J5W9Q5_SOLCO|nr:hypothetical protein H5410_061746 [Solanum commersonii]
MWATLALVSFVTSFTLSILNQLSHEITYLSTEMVTTSSLPFISARFCRAILSLAVESEVEEDGLDFIFFEVTSSRKFNRGKLIHLLSKKQN